MGRARRRLSERVIALIRWLFGADIGARRFPLAVGTAGLGGVLLGMAAAALLPPWALMMVIIASAYTFIRVGTVSRRRARR